MTINIQTEYTSPIDPLWNMIDNLPPGKVVFIRGKDVDIYQIMRNAYMMPQKNRVILKKRIPLSLVASLRDGVVVIDYDIYKDVPWREIANIDYSNVYVFLERGCFDIPSVSIR